MPPSEVSSQILGRETFLGLLSRGVGLLRRVAHRLEVHRPAVVLLDDDLRDPAAAGGSGRSRDKDVSLVLDPRGHGSALRRLELAADQAGALHQGLELPPRRRPAPRDQLAIGARKEALGGNAVAEHGLRSHPYKGRVHLKLRDLTTASTRRSRPARRPARG